MEARHEYSSPPPITQLRVIQINPCQNQSKVSYVPVTQVGFTTSSSAVCITHFFPLPQSYPLQVPQIASVNASLGKYYTIEYYTWQGYTWGNRLKPASKQIRSRTQISITRKYSRAFTFLKQFKNSHEHERVYPWTLWSMKNFPGIIMSDKVILQYILTDLSPQSSQTAVTSHQ